MKAVVAAFNQEKALVGAFSVIVQPVVEPMDRFTALFEAQLLKAGCLFDTAQYGETVSMLETMNTTDRHKQQKKKQEAEAAARAKNMDEATRLYYEVVEIDRRNGKYR